MKKLFIFIILLIIPILTKIYKVDLDKNAYERWEEIILDKKQALHEMRKVLQVNLTETFESILSNETLNKLNQNFTDELKVIARISELPYNYIAAYNYIYEMFAHACTSIIVKREDNSTFLARNLDYSFKALGEILNINVEFIKKGKIIYKASMWAGLIGMHTASKKGSFAIAFNQRNIGNIQDNINQIVNNKTYPVIYMMRQSIEKSNTYQVINNKILKEILIFVIIDK